MKTKIPVKTLFFTSSESECVKIYQNISKYDKIKPKKVNG